MWVQFKRELIQTADNKVLASTIQTYSLSEMQYKGSFGSVVAKSPEVIIELWNRPLNSQRHWQYTLLAKFKLKRK